VTSCGHASVSYVSTMIPLTFYLSISIVGGPYLYRASVRDVVFNATFNNIAVISWRSVLLVEEIGVPEENHRPVAMLIASVNLLQSYIKIQNSRLVTIPMRR
jgi:hypothetical protein